MKMINNNKYNEYYNISLFAILFDDYMMNRKGMIIGDIII